MIPEVFFTADTHFGHRNVIPYCKRPYADVEEMDAAMIQLWNETVKPDDIVYHLGDFAFGPQVRIREVISQLNGYKTLVMGNHDKKTVGWWEDAGFHKVFKPRYGESVPFAIFSRTDGAIETVFRMSHFPFQDVMGEYDDRDYLTPRAPVRAETTVPLVHGHVHEAWRLKPGLVNVGCDVWDYKPVPLSKVLECVDHVRDLPNGTEQESVV
jgi:calcineurin-like phosphoesterase family protein